MRPPFLTQLTYLWQRDPSRLLCIGLDPDPARVPPSLGDGHNPKILCTFLQGIVAATYPFACAFKPQIAHFAAHGWEEELKRLIAWIHECYPDIPVILDAKRGDIGSTAEYYASEAFARYQADAVTVNPYLGSDSLAPYWQRFPERGLFLLCRTSNRGGDDLQMAQLTTGERLYERVAHLAASQWNPHGQTGLVVGATYPEEIARVRALAPNLPILLPGIGAQGGDIAAAVAAGYGTQAFPGIILNSSRAILYASSGDDWQQAAQQAAAATAAAIAAAVAKNEPHSCMP